VGTHITFGILPPHNTDHLSGPWTNGLSGRLKRLLLAGASAFCWMIWLSRNDIVFDKFSIKTFLQVLYTGTHRLMFWLQLEKNDQNKELIHHACFKLETVAMQLYIHHG
jgi:hypothetical protein